MNLTVENVSHFINTEIPFNKLKKNEGISDYSAQSKTGRFLFNKTSTRGRVVV